MRTQRIFSVVLALFLAALLSSCSGPSSPGPTEAGTSSTPAPEQADAGKLVVTFLETPDKHGLAIVVRTPAGKTYLVDSGWQSGNYDAGRDTIAPFLRTQAISEIS